MDFSLATIDINNNTLNFRYDLLPDTCPNCHNAIEPIFKVAYSHDPQVDTPVQGMLSQAVFQCPRNACRLLFIAYYDWNIHSKLFQFKFVKPIQPRDRIFSNEISEISLDFTKIYNEAAKAEMLGWSQIAGCGYRKSIEFLIKDYAISLEEDNSKHGEIKSKWLSKVIKDHVSNEKIRTTAELATWLGNDETHYVRKWTSLDIDDLKKLIELTVRWIEIEIMTNGYSDQMKGQEAQEGTTGEEN